MTKQTNNKWIAGAVKHKGAEKAYCKRQGMSGVTAACISKGMHSPNSTTRHRANLAKTLKKISKNK